MRQPNPFGETNREGAERLIRQARAMLRDESDQIAVDYLDHALAEIEELNRLSASTPAAPSS